MDKTIAGLIGAMGALAAATPSHAAVQTPMDMDSAMTAHSYADLLRPIPNAAALLKASARVAVTPAAFVPGESGQAQIETVQYDQPVAHHHHHHHHHHYVRKHHRRVVVAVPTPHHHHHHHDSTVVIQPHSM
jgi:hypothetical protein